MNLPLLTILRSSGKKLTILLVLSATAAASFATLGDGKKKSSSNKPLLSNRTVTPGYFSLKSGYTYRGNQVISNEKKYISLNTVVTLQKGNTTYVLPLKKKVLISNVKIDIGNRQFRR